MRLWLRFRFDSIDCSTLSLLAPFLLTSSYSSSGLPACPSPAPPWVGLLLHLTNQMLARLSSRASLPARRALAAQVLPVLGSSLSSATAFSSPAPLASYSSSPLSSSPLASFALPIASQLSASRRAFSTLDESSDPQFQPQRKTPPSSAAASSAASDSAGPQVDEGLLKQIDVVVKKHPILLFMKGVPSAPQCGFSSRVVQILNHLGVSYEACNVLSSPELREAIKVYSDWPTFPQLYVKGELVGGCDIVISMFTSGELQQLLGVKPAEPAADAADAKKETTSA